MMACFMFRVRYVWGIGLIGDCDMYELRYNVQFYTSDGLTDATALSSYDAGDYIQVGDILADAIELANTALLERD